MMFYQKIAKRVLDFFLSGILLLMLSPIFLLISIIIKLSSKGPVFFRQSRGGIGGVYFSILKFRSMRVDLEAESKGFEPGCDRRITWIGSILRKTKLDELPQLINVLRGEMAIVGPRPEVRVYIELYPERWNHVLSVRPGITDPASIEYRNEEEILAEAADPEKEYREKILPRKLSLYEKYIAEISFINDMRILVRTFLAVVSK